MINGNLEGVKNSTLDELELLYDYDVSKDVVVSKELAQKLCYFTTLLNREVCVYINRKGKVIDIILGSHETVSLEKIQGQYGKLNGIRCIHTHLNGSGKLSDVDISALIKLKFDTIVSIGVSDENIKSMYCALLKVSDGILTNEYEVYGPYYYDNIEAREVIDKILDNNKKIKTFEFVDNDNLKEQAILVGVQTNSNSIDSTCEESIDELALLAHTAGAVTVKKELQKRDKIDPAYYIGRGKVHEISLSKQSLNASLIIFDDELTGIQIRNLENAIGARVIDRTTLILDIFAKHAKSREGKIQVELAQLKYSISRLTGLGVQMSRLGGGIGTRGPGEKKLEIDKRHINRRISYLEEELRQIKKQREVQRNERIKNNIPVVALIGYTNAGKSTLMNALCSEQVLVDNKLFATLDSTVRKKNLDSGQEFLLIDTVGFIRKLPHHLVESFKSTLEETLYADVLLHVIDSSSKDYEVQKKVVLDILEDLGVWDKPIISVYNKIDLVDEEQVIPYPNENAVKVSAVNNTGLEDLLFYIKGFLSQRYTKIEALIPYDEGNILSKIYDNGKVISKEYRSEGIKIQAYVDDEIYNKYKDVFEV